MKKFIIIFLFIAGQLSVALGQLSIHAGGGFQSLGYSLSEGSRSNGFGYSAGADYQYFFNERWGVGIGAGIASYAAEGELSGYSYSYGATDTDGDAYTMTVAAGRLKEKQRALFAEIPITARYRMPFGEKLSLWASAGVKIGFAARADYELKEGNITTTGFYPQYQWTVSNRPEHGFYTDNLTGESVDLKLKTAISALLEAGISYRLNDRLQVFAGLYGCFGLNDINDEPQNASGIIGTAGDVNSYHGLLASGMTGAVRPIAIGLKAGISFTF